LGPWDRADNAEGGGARGRTRDVNPGVPCEGRSPDGIGRDESPVIDTLREWLPNLVDDLRSSWEREGRWPRFELRLLLYLGLFIAVSRDLDEAKDVSGVEVAELWCRVDRKESSGDMYVEERVGLDDALELSCWTTSTLLWGCDPLAYARELGLPGVITSSSSSKRAVIFIMMLGFAFDMALKSLFDLRECA